MRRRTITIAFCLTLATIPVLCVHSKHVRAGETSQVTLLRTPHEGIQPQTVLDRDGVLHMIYLDRKSTRLNSSHPSISYAVFCLKKKIQRHQLTPSPPHVSSPTLQS